MKDITAAPRSRWARVASPRDIADSAGQNAADRATAGSPRGTEADLASLDLQAAAFLADAQQGHPKPTTPSPAIVAAHTVALATTMGPAGWVIAGPAGLLAADLSRRSARWTLPAMQEDWIASLDALARFLARAGKRGRLIPRRRKTA